MYSNSKIYCRKLINYNLTLKKTFLQIIHSTCLSNLEIAFMAKKKTYQKILRHMSSTYRILVQDISLLVFVSSEDSNYIYIGTACILLWFNFEYALWLEDTYCSLVIYIEPLFVSPTNGAQHRTRTTVFYDFLLQTICPSVLVLCLIKKNNSDQMYSFPRD